MPTETEIKAERERLYESAVLREELNDDEANILLEWGEKHIVRLAGDAVDGAALEQSARFLRQLLKNINRFVGQRQYNNREEQLGYLDKVTQWLGKVGFKEQSSPDLLDQLPSDAKDMNATLRALLNAIDPRSAASDASGKTPPPGGQLAALKEAIAAQNAELTGEAPRPQKDDSGEKLAHTPFSSSPPRPQQDEKPSQGPFSATPPKPHQDDKPSHGPFSDSPPRPQQDEKSASEESLAQSIMDQMKKASTPASALRDSVEETHSDTKENEALNSLLKNLGVSSESDSEERHLTRPSKDEDTSRRSASHANPNQRINQPHMREQDQDDGKE